MLWIGKVSAEPIVENFLSLCKLGQSSSIAFVMKRVRQTDMYERRTGFLLKILSTSQVLMRSLADERSIVACDRLADDLSARAPDPGWSVKDTEVPIPDRRDAIRLYRKSLIDCWHH
jgi:hypothetical protein